jgi:hypothetical protein
MIQPQIIPFWLTVAGSLGIGAFLGNLIGLYVSWKLRQREWLRDTKKQEWRELISTLSRTFHYFRNYGHVSVMSGEQEQGLLQADAEARSIIGDRIFIANQMRSGNILERWQLLVNEQDFSRMWEYWNHLHNDLVAAAYKDCGVKDISS